MKLIVATLFSLSLMVHADSIAFPNSLSAKTLSDRYGPELATFEKATSERYRMTIYNPSRPAETRTAAEQGLVVTSPARVIDSINEGLVPVGYHDGFTKMVLVQRAFSDSDSNCLRIARLPKISTMGWLEPYLLKESQLVEMCDVQALNMVNGLRLLKTNQADLVVAGFNTYQRFAANYGGHYTILASVMSPTFVFMTTPKQQAKWVERFEKIEAAGVTAPNGNPVRVWNLAILKRFEKFSQISVSS